MVSKSKILGESSLIFVTVGSTNFKFDRLFNSIDNALVSLKSEAKLVVQAGESDYKWKYKNIILKRYLNPKKISFYYKIADKIITHGGFGSIFSLSNKARIMPLVIARLKKYKEHVNDHQKDFLAFFKKKNSHNLKKYFIDNEFINRPILAFLRHKPESNCISELFSKSNKKLLMKRLHQYISNLNY